MEVILNRWDKYLTECHRCYSIFKFSESDTKTQEDDYDGLHWHRFVNCPCCGNKIIISIDGVNTNQKIKEV